MSHHLPVASDLPEDILMDILCRLPVKSLLRFMTVHKSWRALVKNPNFIDMHIKQSNGSAYFAVMRCRQDIALRCFVSLLSRETFKVDRNMVVPCRLYQSLCSEIVGCCNGVICLAANDILHAYYLFNPATREFKTLPHPSNLIDQVPKHIGHGFGFDPKANDYKLVRVFDSFKDTVAGTEKVFSKVDVYTLSTDSWRRTKLSVDGIVINDFCKAFVNGALHWKAVRVKDNADHRFILSFDLGNEAFRDIQLPGPEIVLGQKEWCVSVLKESLSVIFTTRGEGNMASFVVWVMNEYGVQESWNKHFTIGPCSNIKRVVGFVRNCEILLEDFHSRLIVYDPSNIEGGKSMEIGKHVSPIQMVNYVESLVPIKGKQVDGKITFMDVLFIVIVLVLFFLTSAIQIGSWT